MWAIFSDVSPGLFGPQSEIERVEESGRKTPLLISQAFPMVGGQRGDGGNEADDDSLRKMKTNKQRQLSNQMDSEAKSAERVDALTQSPSQ